MLSILIPVYNYDVNALVSELKLQADELGIKYEILAQDDNSQIFKSENEKINSLSNCHYQVNPKNIGRGKNINLLCSKANEDYVLIMESDSFPENKNYLKNYLTLISNDTSIIFGGVKYPETIPEKDKILRWKYGHARETKSLKERQKSNYSFVFTWNLLLRKEILLQYPFPEFIREYGYEDAIFIKSLRLNSVPISHIENHLIHNNNENSIDFIQKTERAVNTLYNLINQQKIDFKDIKLSKVYLVLKKLHLIGLVKVIYNKTRQRILTNLKSGNPNLYLLDFYKLGYLCSMTPTKNV
ncbi:glycosyltransferase [Flavobacterium aquicola]|uniref:Glycosyl transferase family 2 n=1 Tax=Flavobacterium aquicola TaxID=1682742 RepID=A0A3E0EJV3_9FLAO|nr:glycosyltransferase [Flavobacterium aquicola]REG98461.1 glycosyl transferase family 2 [Flavobacterium aquicola]